MKEHKRLRALLIEDSADDAELLLIELKRNGYDVYWIRVETEKDLLEALHNHEWDVIISDYSMPSFSAPIALKLVQQQKIDIPFIIVSGTVGEDTAVSSMKAGAHDFFVKNKLQRLIPAIERELREAQERHHRKSIENQLRQSEERFAKAFHASPVGISITSADGIFMDVNDYFLKMVGFTREEVIGHHIDELNILSDPEIREHVRQMLNSKEAVRNYEMQYRMNSGEIRDVLASFEYIELGGNPCELGLFHDVTERKQAQDELRALYNATSYLFQANSIASLGNQIVQAVVQELGQIDCGLMLVNHNENRMYRVARAGEYALTNAPLYLDSRGLVAESVRTQAVIYVPDVGEDTRYLANNAETRSEFVIPLRTTTGVLGVLDLQSSRLNAFTEREQRIVIAFSERAAAAIEAMQLYEEINRHAAELEWRVNERTAELQQAKDRVETILNNSSDAILLVSADGLIQQTNDAFTHLFAMSQADAIGIPLNAIFAPENVTTVTQTLSEVINSRQSARVDVNGLRSDGTVFDAELAFALVMEDDKRRPHMICNIRDITERKRAEQELIHALEKEREVNELKSRFVSMVSHEFRTPLSTILSSSEVLKTYRERMTPDKQIQHFDRIHVQVKRMTGLLDDVLTLSKAEAIGMSVALTPTDLETFSRDIVEDMLFIAPEYKIDYSFTGEQRRAYIDPELIRQVLTNLFSNALKYSSPAEPICFRVTSSEHAVSFEVQDSGIGIPDEDQPRLFEAFHRARNSGTIQGTGLGLAIVKRAVDAHRGTISFRSKINQGTTFIVTIPVKTDERT